MNYQKNIEILKANHIYVCNSEPVWDNKPDSVELETYTDAGEDMIIYLEEPTKACLEEYINGFDIDEQVMLWWQRGAEAAHAKGVPFHNIREHYQDYESYLYKLLQVAECME